MRNNIISFIAGAVIIAVAYLGVVFFKSIKAINTHEQALTEIVDFLNKQIGASQGAQPVANSIVE